MKLSKVVLSMKACDKRLVVLGFIQILAICLFMPVAYSQDTIDCALKLKDAQSLYDNGLVAQIPDLLNDCLISGFTKEEELTAYKLIILTYLFDDKINQADSAMLGFLKKNPEYEISPTDHTSFIYLYNKFVIKPVVQLGVHIGTNLPFVSFVTYDPLGGEQGKVSYSSKAANLFISLETKFKLGNNTDMSIEPGFSQLSFTRIEYFMGFEKNEYIETQQRIEIPVSITYGYKNFGKFTLYGRMGMGAGLNLKTVAKVTSNPTDKNNLDINAGEDVRREDSRISTDAFAQLGAGIKYKIPHGFFMMEVRTNLGLRNQTIPGSSSAEYLAYYNHYQDDLFHMNALNFNIGYAYVFYKPLKREE
jgi:hypothetical protein